MLARIKRPFVLFLASTVCRLFHLSYRYRIYNLPHREAAERMHAQRAFAIASWHQNCFAGILAHAGQGIALLVSKSFDGEIVSQVARTLGLVTVRGSSKKGGAEALEVLIEQTHKGKRSAITIDGPKGPIYEIKRGILTLSASTGAPILPLLAIGTSYWTLSRSWDRFRLPKPFTKVAVIYGRPFIVTPEELQNSIDSVRARLAEEMLRIEEQARSLGLQISR